MDPRPRPRTPARAWYESSAFQIGATALVVSGLWAGLTVVPVEHHLLEHFSVWGTGTDGCGTTTSFSVPSRGTFDFEWRANTSASGFLSLYGAVATISQLYEPYSAGGVNGTGNISVVPGVEYYFEYCGEWNETASGQGTLSFSAPLDWGW